MPEINPSLNAELLDLVNIVRAHRKRAPLGRLEPTQLLREDLELDSLDLAELTVRIEERFGVDVFAAGVVRRWGEVQEQVEHALRST